VSSDRLSLPEIPPHLAVDVDARKLCSDQTYKEIGAFLKALNPVLQSPIETLMSQYLNAGTDVLEGDEKLMIRFDALLWELVKAVRLSSQRLRFVRDSLVLANDPDFNTSAKAQITDIPLNLDETICPISGDCTLDTDSSSSPERAD